jgi:hypothetical protein
VKDAIEEHRVLLLEQLRALQQEYHALAKPIIDQLVRLENLLPPKPYIVPMTDVYAGADKDYFGDEARQMHLADLKKRDYKGPY